MSWGEPNCCSRSSQTCAPQPHTHCACLLPRTSVVSPVDAGRLQRFPNLLPEVSASTSLMNETAPGACVTEVLRGRSPPPCTNPASAPNSSLVFLAGQMPCLRQSLQPFPPLWGKTSAGPEASLAKGLGTWTGSLWVALFWHCLSTTWVSFQPKGGRQDLALAPAESGLLKARAFERSVFFKKSLLGGKLLHRLLCLTPPGASLMDGAELSLSAPLNSECDRGSISPEQLPWLPFAGSSAGRQKGLSKGTPGGAIWPLPGGSHLSQHCVFVSIHPDQLQNWHEQGGTGQTGLVPP